MEPFGAEVVAGFGEVDDDVESGISDIVQGFDVGFIFLADRSDVFLKDFNHVEFA